MFSYFPQTSYSLVFVINQEIDQFTTVVLFLNSGQSLCCLKNILLTVCTFQTRECFTTSNSLPDTHLLTISKKSSFSIKVLRRISCHCPYV